MASLVKRIVLYPREMNTGVIEDHSERFMSSEFVNISHGRVVDDGTVRLTA